LLLEFVKDLPRTEKDIAAMLVEQVGDAPPVAAVIPGWDIENHTDSWL
jgi:hypothetical protein